MVAVAFVLGVIAVFALVGPRVGYTYAVVKSGSMAPAYPPGAVIVIRDVDPARVQVGDVISFRAPAGGHDEIVTHRVVALEQLDGSLAFRTKGDANEQPDARAIPASQVKGRVIFSLPKVGYAAPVVQTKGLFFGIVLVCGSLLIALELRNILRETRGSKGPAG